MTKEVIPDRNKSSSVHHYALDVAALLDACRRRICLIINSPGQYRHPRLVALDSTLESCENLVHDYLMSLLAREQEIVNEIEEKGANNNFSDNAHAQMSCGKSQVSMIMKIATKLRVAEEKKYNAYRNALKDYRKPKSIRHYTDDYFPLDLSPTSKERTRKGYSNKANLGEKGFGRKDKQNSWKAQNTTKHKYSQINRGPEDSLLFNLVVSLQLCYLRLEDADSNLCGRENAMRRSDEMVLELAHSFINSDMDLDEYRTHVMKESHPNGNKRRNLEKNYEFLLEDDQNESKTTSSIISNNCGTFWPWSKRTGNLICVTALGIGGLLLGRTSQKMDQKQKEDMTRTTMKAVMIIGVSAVIRRRWMLLTMNARLINSTTAIDLWQQKWIVHQSLTSQPNHVRFDDNVLEITDRRKINVGDGKNSSSMMANARAKRFIESIPFQSAESSFWQSQGALRFLLLKKAMDLVYASIGTAIEVTGSESNSGVWMPVAAAAASYYAITGPDATASRLAQVMSSSSYDLLKRAWGMVSLPAVKRLSLEVSKLLKGAAIATRISIAGVPCFVLSRDSYPPLSTAMKRFCRQQKREVSNLTTIMETSEHTPVTYPRRAIHVEDYPKKDVILHMTGGGFFAHTIAGDLPYLIDWSGHTNAVVICPEYALLPEHAYPIALNQITDIYCSLIGGDAAPLLGFQPDRVIVTGESAGGNLAAALCVKLCLDYIVDTNEDEIQNNENTVLQQSNMSNSVKYPGEHAKAQIRLPDAMMLCCPALNLSLTMSHSRVMGDDDPVLPSGLISAISDAYLPSSKEVSKDDPLASPYFAPDSILRFFPSTLLYASSADPLLDDSVHFNARLKQLGVDSNLRAAHHMPHAYWGLGTAGFPEAQVVQNECQAWLVKQFGKGRN